MSLHMYGPTPKDSGSIIEAITSGDPKLGDQAVIALGKSPASVATRVADAVAERLRAGDHIPAICDFLGRAGSPRFAREQWTAIGEALVVASATGPVSDEVIRHWNRRGPDPDFDERRAGGRRLKWKKSFLGRALSVFTRAWVLAISLFVVIGLISLIAGGQIRGALVLLVCACGLFITVDMIRRQCPKCRMLLGGMLTRIEATGSYETTEKTPSGDVTRTVNTHTRSWKCAGCSHEWQT